MKCKVFTPVGQGCRTIMSIRWGDDVHSLGKCLKHNDMYLITCLGCGEKFHSLMPTAKTCSGKCRVRLHRIRHAVMFQNIMRLTA